MGKKKRAQPDIEEILSRPWCYYCERDFDDLRILINHQKAKHYKCERCGRRLNTAGGLTVHMQQVHKETLSQVDNALPNRAGLDLEIFGMEGIPEEILNQHRQRVIQQFYQAEAEHRAHTGNPAPGTSHSTAGGPNPSKKPRVETPEEIQKRLAEHRAKKAAAAAGGSPANSGNATRPEPSGNAQNHTTYQQGGSPFVYQPPPSQDPISNTHTPAVTYGAPVPYTAPGAYSVPVSYSQAPPSHNMTEQQQYPPQQQGFAGYSDPHVPPYGAGSPFPPQQAPYPGHQPHYSAPQGPYGPPQPPYGAPQPPYGAQPQYGNSNQAYSTTQPGYGTGPPPPTSLPNRPFGLSPVPGLPQRPPVPPHSPQATYQQPPQQQTHQIQSRAETNAQNPSNLGKLNEHINTHVLTPANPVPQNDQVPKETPTDAKSGPVLETTKATKPKKPVTLVWQHEDISQEELMAAFPKYQVQRS